jgi:hypothetical protein
MNAVSRPHENAKQEIYLGYMNMGLVCSFVAVYRESCYRELDGYNSIISVCRATRVHLNINVINTFQAFLFSRLEVNMWLRFSGLGRVECWLLSKLSENRSVAIFKFNDFGAASWGLRRLLYCCLIWRCFCAA